MESMNKKNGKTDDKKLREGEEGKMVKRITLRELRKIR